MSNREFELTDRLSKLVAKATQQEAEIKKLQSDFTAERIANQQLRMRLQDAQRKFFTERERNDNLIQEVSILSHSVQTLQTARFPGDTAPPPVVAANLTPQSPLTPHLPQTPPEQWRCDLSQISSSRIFSSNAVETLCRGTTDYSGEIFVTDGIRGAIAVSISDKEDRKSVV